VTGRGWVVACVGSAAVAYWLGARTSAAPSAPATPPAIASAPVAAAPVIAVAPGQAVGLTRDDLRAVIREELAARAESPVAAAPASDDGAAPTPALATAHAAVDTGLHDGVWDERDREVLRAQLVHLRPAEIDEVLSPLFRAINDQRVRLDGAPL
jgi:hypothetical protein